MVKLTITKLENAYKKIEEYRKSHADYVKQLGQAITSTDGEWLGEAQVELKSKYNSMKKDFDSMDAMLESYAKFLKNYAEEMRTGDKK